MTLKKQLRKRGSVHILPECCKDCGFCIWICPVNTLRRSKEANGHDYHYPVYTGKCIACKRYEEICPDFTYSLKNVKLRNRICFISCATCRVS